MKIKFLDKNAGNKAYRIALMEIYNFVSKINALEDFRLNTFSF